MMVQTNGQERGKCACLIGRLIKVVVVVGCRVLAPRKVQGKQVQKAAGRPPQRCFVVITFEVEGVASAL